VPPQAANAASLLWANRELQAPAAGQQLIHSEMRFDMTNPGAGSAVLQVSSLHRVAGDGIRAQPRSPFWVPCPRLPVAT
jgi:hypothetical protein